MTQVRLAPPDRPQDSALGAVALAALLLAYGLPVYNFFAVNVALGSLTTDLGVGPAMLQLVVAGFGVAYASTVVLGGRLGDRYGRRRVLVTGLIALAVSSALCALAPAPEALIGARVGQGLGAALLAPQVLALIQTETSGAARTRALGWFGAMAGIASCAAFIIGGALVQWNPGGLGWRMLFWFNVVAVLAVLPATRRVPESLGAPAGRPDVAGAVLLTVGVTLLVLPITEGRAAGWPWWSWAMLMVAVPVLALFGVRQLRLERNDGEPLIPHRGEPLIPPSLLRHRSMSAGLGVLIGYSTVFSGFMFVVSLAAAQAGRLGPIGIGVVLAPFALGFLITSLLIPRSSTAGVTLMRRGMTCAAAGLVTLGLAATVGWPHFGWWLVPSLALLGVGQGLTLVPLFGTVLGGVPAAQAGVGGGTLLTAMQMALGIGSAAIGTAFLALGGPTGGATPMLVILVGCGVAVLGARYLAGLLSR